MTPEKKDDLLLCYADTVLWTANNGYRDILAQSVIYKLGRVTLATRVNHETDNHTTPGRAVFNNVKEVYGT